MPTLKSALKSMTAFGRGSAADSYGIFTVEIQSINRKHLDIQFFLPRSLMRLESELRNKIGTLITRGAINVWVNWQKNFEVSSDIIPNIPLAQAMQCAWEKLAAALNLEEKIPLSLLVQERELFLRDETKLEEEKKWTGLKTALQVALDDLIQMKLDEGLRLALDLIKRTENIKLELQTLQVLSTTLVEKFRQKILPRLSELFPENGQYEERLFKEAVLYADKVDITEEMVRLSSHIEQIQNIIQEKEFLREANGKKLEFLIAELNREVTTINSKAPDLEVSKCVMQMKVEIEKMREQIQNIE